MSNRAWKRRRSDRWARRNHQWMHFLTLEEFVDQLYSRMFLPYADDFELVK